ncbi:Gag protein [Colletotrichum asianum]
MLNLRKYKLSLTKARFKDALRSLFQDPNEKQQTKRDLAQLQQTKLAKEYAATFRQLSIQLDLTKETKIFMFY